MTEAEWDSSTDPHAMVFFVDEKASVRKFRLFAVACCRRVWRWMPDEARSAVDVCEAYADGRVGRKRLAAARRAAYAASNLPPDPSGGRYAQARSHAGTVALFACSSLKEGEAPCQMAGSVAGAARSLVAHTDGDAAGAAERTAQAALLHDIFGNPFRPVAVDPAWMAWNGGAPVQLAAAAYEERELPCGHLDAARLAVLADMLKKAGCTDAHVLGHLRSPGAHVRGCHVVDALLGRS